MAALNRGKESRPSWHSSRALILGSLLSVLSLAATVGPMASVQRPSPPTSKSDIRIRRSVTALAVSERKDFVDAVLALKRPDLSNKLQAFRIAQSEKVLAEAL